MTTDKPTPEEMRAYLDARSYVRCLRGGWVETYANGTGMRWTFFPRDGRRRPSPDYSLEMAYERAVSGAFRDLE